MSPAKIGFRLFLALMIASSLLLGGCSYMPWAGDSEEDDLAFEDDFPFEDEPKSDTPAMEASHEDAFFAEDPVAEPAAEAVVEAAPTLHGDVESLQLKQEALVSKVREMEEMLTTMEPKVEAAHERIEGEREGVEKVEMLEPEVELLKAEVTELKSEIARLKEQKAAAMAAAPVPAMKPSKASARGIPPEYNRALAAYNSGHYDDSILQFQNLALSNPPTSLQDNILFWIGSNYVKLEMYDDAIKNFESVITRYPRGNKVHDSRYMLGVSYYKKGESSRAIEILQSALQSNPPAEVKGKILAQLKAIQ